MKVALLWTPILLVLMKACRSELMENNPAVKHFIADEGRFRVSVHNGAPLDDSDGSNRDNRYFSGYPDMGYNAYYDPFAGYYATYRYPLKDHNGLVKNFHRDCAEAYPNRRYACYGYGGYGYGR